MSFNANKGHERIKVFCLHFELEYKIYVRSGFRRYHQNKYQIHKCDVAIIIGEKISATKKKDMAADIWDNFHSLV